VTAVFSRITIVELNLPSSASTASVEPTFRLEVIVRKEGLELTNGSALIATIPNVKGEYDLKTLSELVLSLKRDYPDADQASVLLEPEIEYDYLIRVMDVVRSMEVPIAAEPGAGTPEAGDAQPGDPDSGAPQMTRVALFTEIAVGDAP
jgi:biopolymer transport protein ExbD